jgi:hypothetical protein
MAPSESDREVYHSQLVRRAMDDPDLANIFGVLIEQYNYYEHIIVDQESQIVEQDVQSEMREQTMKRIIDDKDKEIAELRARLQELERPSTAQR